MTMLNALCPLSAPVIESFSMVYCWSIDFVKDKTKVIISYKKLSSDWNDEHEHVNNNNNNWNCDLFPCVHCFVFFFSSFWYGNNIPSIKHPLDSFICFQFTLKSMIEDWRQRIFPRLHSNSFECVNTLAVC